MTSEFAVAVHGLVYLNHKKVIVSSEELAANVCTNPARVRKVMAKLKKAGIISTKEGLEGGYQFMKDPSEVNLRSVCEALDVTFVSSSWKSGRDDVPCMISSGMAGVMDEVYSRLDELCKKNIEGITIKQIEEELIQKKKARTK